MPRKMSTIFPNTSRSSLRVQSVHYLSEYFEELLESPVAPRFTSFQSWISRVAEVAEIRKELSPSFPGLFHILIDSCFPDCLEMNERTYPPASRRSSTSSP